MPFLNDDAFVAMLEADGRPEHDVEMLDEVRVSLGISDGRLPRGPLSYSKRKTVACLLKVVGMQPAFCSLRNCMAWEAFSESGETVAVTINLDCDVEYDNILIEIKK